MTASPQLGALLALTGPEAAYARQLRHAIELAVADAGADLDLHIEDDHADPDRAAAAADRLAANPRLVGIVGPMNSWTAETAAPVLARAGLAFITPSASNASFADRGWAPFFRACPSDAVQARALAALAARRVGARTVAAADDGSAFSSPLSAAFLADATALGLSSAGHWRCEHRSLDDIAAAIAAARPDAVLVSGLEDACRLTATALRHHGFYGTLLGTDGIKPSRALHVPGAPAVWLTNSGTDARHRAPAFDRRMREAAGEHFSIYTVEGYDAMAALVSLLRSGVATRPDMVAALHEQGPFRGLVDPLAFDRRGDRLDAEIGVYIDDDSGVRFEGTVSELLR